MTDNILAKFIKVAAILGANLVIQILIYFAISRLGLSQNDRFYIGTILLVLIVILFIISGIAIYVWINDSAKAKRLYTIITLLLIFIQWSLGFTLIEWVAKNMWRIYFIRIFS